MANCEKSLEDDILNPTSQEDDVAAVNSPPKVETVLQLW